MTFFLRYLRNISSWTQQAVVQIWIDTDLFWRQDKAAAKLTFSFGTQDNSFGNYVSKKSHTLLRLVVILSGKSDVKII